MGGSPILVTACCVMALSALYPHCSTVQATRGGYKWGKYGHGGYGKGGNSGSGGRYGHRSAMTATDVYGNAKPESNEHGPMKEDQGKYGPSYPVGKTAKAQGKHPDDNHHNSASNGKQDSWLILHYKNFTHMSDVRAPRCRATYDLLCLRGNLLTRIDDYDFDPYRILETLDLSSNRLKSISKKAFEGTALRKLYIEQNKLSCVPHLGSIRPSLHTLKAGYNQLGDCRDDPTYTDTFPVLNTLEFPGNTLIDLPAITFSAPNLYNLDVTNNSLKHLENVDRHASQVHYLKLKGNPLHCGCEALWIKEVEMREDREVRGDRCHDTGPLGGTDWSSLTLQDLQMVCAMQQYKAAGRLNTANLS